jgi:hypothetical protein
VTKCGFGDKVWVRIQIGSRKNTSAYSINKVIIAIQLTILRCPSLLWFTLQLSGIPPTLSVLSSTMLQSRLRLLKLKALVFVAQGMVFAIGIQHGRTVVVRRIGLQYRSSGLGCQAIMLASVKLWTGSLLVIQHNLTTSTTGPVRISLDYF